MPDLRYDQNVSGLGGEYTAKHGVKRMAYIEEFDLENPQVHWWIR